jgi:hypothetical protein
MIGDVFFRKRGQPFEGNVILEQILYYFLLYFVESLG